MYPVLTLSWVPSYFYGYVDSNYGTRGTEHIDPFGNGMYESTWTNFYGIIGKCNPIINSVESSANYQETITGAPTILSQIYGEAICMRATCYYELIRHFGDVAFQVEAGKVATHLTNRDSVAEYILRDLERVIPVMFRSGESSGIDKSNFNRTYAEGLVGRICLWMGGYQALHESASMAVVPTGRHSTHWLRSIWAMLLLTTVISCSRPQTHVVATVSAILTNTCSSRQW